MIYTIQSVPWVLLQDDPGLIFLAIVGAIFTVILVLISIAALISNMRKK